MNKKKSAAKSPDNNPSPKMRSRKEIERHIAELQKEPHEIAYLRALRWVLGIEESA